MAVVITGGGSGIGQALAWRLAANGYHVLVAGRRSAALEQTAAQYDAIQTCPADVSEPAGREAIVEAVGEDSVQWLIHNAGVLEPVGPLLSQSPEALRQAWAVNVEGPIALSAALVAKMPPGSRILHVSSGAAHNAYPGWGAYCMTKAALLMAYQILRMELADRQIAVGSVRPGVVDTPMQGLIRQQAEKDFPAVKRFQELKRSGSLLDAQTVAVFMHQLLESTDAESFGAKEWDVRDAQ